MNLKIYSTHKCTRPLTFQGFFFSLSASQPRLAEADALHAQRVCTGASYCHRDEGGGVDEILDKLVSLSVLIQEQETTLIQKQETTLIQEQETTSLNSQVSQSTAAQALRHLSTLEASSPAATAVAAKTMAVGAAQDLAARSCAAKSPSATGIAATCQAPAEPAQCAELVSAKRDLVYRQAQCAELVKELGACCEEAGACCEEASCVSRHLAERAADRSQYQAQTAAAWEAQVAAQRSQYQAQVTAECQARCAAQVNGARSEYEARIAAEWEAKVAGERARYQAQITADREVLGLFCLYVRYQVSFAYIYYARG